MAIHKVEHRGYDATHIATVTLSARRWLASLHCSRVASTQMDDVCPAGYWLPAVLRALVARTMFVVAKDDTSSLSCHLIVVSRSH